MKLEPMLLEILACPACHGSLTVEEAADELHCPACALAYPVLDDIPVLLIDQARPISAA